MDLVVYSETFMLYEKYFKFGHKLEMVEPMMKKIAASRTPGLPFSECECNNRSQSNVVSGPFYVPYMCAVACFNVWIQLKNTHSSTSKRCEYP